LIPLLRAFFRLNRNFLSSQEGGSSNLTIWKVQNQRCGKIERSGDALKAFQFDFMTLAIAESERQRLVPL
jgi:hypothetical protein